MKWNGQTKRNDGLIRNNKQQTETEGQDRQREQEKHSEYNVRK